MTTEWVNCAEAREQYWAPQQLFLLRRTKPGELGPRWGDHGLHITCQPLTRSPTSTSHSCFSLVTNCSVDFVLFYSQTWSHCVVTAVQNSLWESKAPHPSTEFPLILLLKPYEEKLYRGWTRFTSHEKKKMDSLCLYSNSFHWSEEETWLEGSKMYLCYDGFLILHPLRLLWVLLQAKDFRKWYWLPTSAQDCLACANIGYSQAKTTCWIGSVGSNVAQESRGTQLLASHS